jgi:hypothetical protein
LSFDSGNHKFGKINKLLNLGKEWFYHFKQSSFYPTTIVTMYF